MPPRWSRGPPSNWSSLPSLTGFRPDEPENSLPRGGVGHVVDLSLLVLAEGHDGHARRLDRPVGDHAFLLLVVLERPEPAGDVVAVEVMAVQLRQVLPAVD